MAYRNTLQGDALKRVAQSLQSSLAVGAGADDLLDGDGAPQRTLFSWAEFMAGEPDEPPRGRRDEAPTLSLFEWAVEQEREGALAGAGS